MDSETLAVRKPRFLAISFGFTATLFAAIVVVAAVSSGTAHAISYTITTSGGPIKDWNTPTTWSPNGVPGSAPGDTVNITTANAQVQLTTGLANPLSGLSIGGTSIVVEVAGGSLTLAGASSIGSGATLRLISNGSTTLNGSAMTIGSGGVLQSQGGVIDGTGGGTLSISSGGQLNVAGTTTLANGLGVTNSGGTITTNGGQLVINSGSSITNASGTLNVQDTLGITSDNAATQIDVNGGTLTYSGSGAGTIAVLVNIGSSGTVSASTSNLILSQGGTHQGAFNTAAPGATITFGGGVHQFLTGTSFTGSGTIALTSGTFDLDADTTIPATVVFTQTGGFLTGLGNLTISGTYNWNGGDTDSSLGAGTTTINGTLNIGSTAEKGLYQRTINNAGTTNWTGGNIRHAFSGVFNNTGTFNIQSDRFIFYGSGGDKLTFNNSGTVTKSVTTGTTTWGAHYNQTAGSTTISTGTLYFNNGTGSYTGGTISASSGARLDWGSGDNHTVAAGASVSGAGTLGFRAGATFIYGAYNVTGLTDVFGGTARIEASADTNQLSLSGGTIAGAGTLNVSGAATWSGFGAMSGSGGTTNFLNTSTLTITSVEPKSHVFRTINNAGVVTWTGGDINGGYGGTFNNTGTFNIQSDKSYVFAEGSPLPVFNNSGTISKSVTTGTTTLNVAFNQTGGSTTVSTGQLTLSNGGSSTGSIVLTNTANQLNITSGTFTMNAGTAVSGNGYVAVNGASALLTLGSALTIPRVALKSGTIDGATLTISSALLWQGGKFLGPGTTIMSGGSTIDHTTPTAATFLDGRTFDTTGTFNYTPGTNFLTLTNGATLNNNIGGSFNILGDSQIGNGSGANTFNNAGSLIKSGGTSGTVFNVPVTNSNSIGVVGAAGRTIIFANGGSMSAGAITAASTGTNVHFFGGTFTVNGGNFSGTSGTVAVLGTGQLNIAVNATSTATISVEAGGTLDVAATRIFDTDFFEWTGGTIQGGGQTKVAISGNITATAPTLLTGGNQLAVFGTVNYSGNGTNFLTISGTSQLAVISGGTLNLTADGIIAGTSPASVTSAGTLLKTAGSGVSRIDTMFTTTTGTFGATSGTLHLKGIGGSIANTVIDTGVAGTIQFEGAYNVTAGSSVAGTGTITLTGGTLDMAPNVVIQTFLMNGGILSGTGNVVAKGGSWSGGTMSGTGTTTVAAPATFGITGSTPLTLARNFANLGIVNASPVNTLNFTGAAVLTNAGTWNDSNRQLVCVSCTGRFHNATGGTYNKIGTGGGVLQQNIRFDNDGSVIVGSTSGVAFNGGGTHTGDFATDNQIWFGGTHTFASTTDITGTGSIVFINSSTHQGSLNLSGVLSTITIQSTADVTFNTTSAVTSPRFAIAGNISGTGALSITGTGSTWSGGTVSGTAGFSIASGADLSINNSSGTPMLDGGRTLTNNGTLAITGNLAAGLGGGSIVNTSGFRALPAAGITIGPAFTNQASAQFGSGTTTFNGGYTQTAGSTELVGGNFGSPLSINIDGGTVSGNGTITANVINDGSFNPGLSPGTITIAGNFTQSNTGVINSQIGGTTPGTGYDQLVVTGNAALDGTMNVTLINSFSPADNNVFDLVTWGSRTGAFAAVNLPPFPAGTLIPTYEPNAFRITADAIGDLGITKTGPANAAVGQNISYTIVVTNGGPSSADSVTVSDPTPANLTFVSNSGDCTTAFPCSLGTVGAGATRTIVATYTVTGGAGSNITNTATVTTTSTDSSTANNTSSTTTFVVLADVSVTKTGPANAAIGQNVSYTIVVNNGGPSPADNVTVSDPTPANLTFVSNSGDCTTAFPCSLGTVGAGATRTIVATYTVTGGAGSNITNTATVTTTSTDSSTANNTSSTTTFVVLADVSVTKTGPANAAIGQNVSYTIVVNNGGPSAADSVTVSDPTPANLTFVSNSGDCTTAFPCSLGTVPAGATRTIVATYTITGGAGSNITNTATVTTTSTDNSTANNTSSATTFVDMADVSVTKTGPANAGTGQNISYTIVVNNGGPSPAGNVTVSDPTPANLSFVSNSGDCTTPFPCSLGTINAGVTRTITATYAVTGGAGSTITNTATVSTTTPENTTANNSASANVFVDLSDLAISKTGPTAGRVSDNISFTITVANGGQSIAGNVVVEDPTPDGLIFVANTGDCTTAFPCSLGSLPGGATKTIVATYTVIAIAAGTTVTNTATVTTTTADNASNNTASASVAIDCVNSAPSNLAPTGTAAGSGTLSWRGNGSSYRVYLGPAGSGCTTLFTTTSSRSVPYSNLAPGTYEWRVESLQPGCERTGSACVTFTVPSTCTVPDAPIVSVVGQTTSAKTYDVQWDAVPGAVRYEIDEATNAEFTGATRQVVTGTSQSYKHDVTVATAFFYRVRAFAECTTAPGPFSTTVRVVIIPLPPKEQGNPQVNVPAGSKEVVVQTVFIPGQPGQTLFFTATTDRPWLTVRPQMGTLTPAGINLEVIADPKTLPNGTFTASIIVTVTDGTSGRIATNGSSVITTPFSINLVTPVTPIAAKPPTSQYSLVIPTAGHLDGVNSHWQSDIRVTNAGFKPARYQLTFTPSGGTSQGVKQTNINVDAGATTALDDIVRNWFGLGTLNDGSNGMLEIMPLDDPATTSLSTVASSRTYNVSGNGTLGQYIPAVPFPSFIGKALPNALPQVLSLQQIAQSPAYRTNVGLAEAGGASVNAVMTVFSASGSKLKEIPVSLSAGQQLQMNQLLATNGIELSDGRIEVKVTGGDGKITAYASVVDNATQDPLLVNGIALSGAGATKFVLPGVANLDNSVAHWRTDMRVFNYGTTSQPAMLTFFPFNNGPSKSASVLLGAGQVMTLDNVLKTQFDTENAGGVVHLTTPQPASLVVTGRTYNQTDNGTFGQFVPAVTVDQAVGANERTLHILQVEDSTRYRTNVGLAEVSGKPVTVELQVVLPDSKITPTVQIPLAANEFRQFNVIRELGVGNVYNGRITVRVIDGQGRVTAYGSVIDEVTQDPTYVPAQ